MKTVRLLIILAAFLIMISSAFTLLATTDRTAVYINIFAMLSLAVAVTIMISKTPESVRTNKFSIRCTK